MEARDYQTRGIELIRQAFHDGFRRILFWLATGGGKSIIFIILVTNLLKNNRKVIFVVKRRQLIFQAKNHFEKNGIQCSIVMGNEKGFDNSKNLQICSIDTITNRDISFLKDSDFCIVDECHDCTAPAYQTFFNDLESMNKNMCFIGLTATPFPVGKKVHDFFQCVVKPIEMHELKDKGFLVREETYVPAELDLSSIKIDSKSGDYQVNPLAEKMSELKIVGDVIKTYKEKGNGKTAILFAVNKDHSKIMADCFNKEGILAVHCDESTVQKERDRAINLLKHSAASGIPFVLCNVNIFSTGVDIPEAEIGIMARPTRSEILYIQQAGRLIRPFKRCAKCNSGYAVETICPSCGHDVASYTKEKAIFLDHGGNVLKHGTIYDVRKAIIKKEDIEKRQEEEEEKIKLKTCKICFAVYPSNLKQCPFCQHENDKQERVIKRADGKLVPYNEYNTIKECFVQLEIIKIQRRYKANWSYFKLYEKFGDKVFMYPDLQIPKWIPKIIEKNKVKEQNVYR